MADVVNPIIVEFVRQKERRIADLLLGIDAWLDVESTYYVNHVAPLVAEYVNADPVIDSDLETSGRVRLNIGDVKALAVAISGVASAINAAKATLIKASVNPRNPLGDL